LVAEGRNDILIALVREAMKGFDKNTRDAQKKLVPYIPMLQALEEEAHGQWVMQRAGEEGDRADQLLRHAL